MHLSAYDKTRFTHPNMHPMIHGYIYCICCKHATCILDDWNIWKLKIIFSQFALSNFLIYHNIIKCPLEEVKHLHLFVQISWIVETIYPWIILWIQLYSSFIFPLINKLVFIIKWPFFRAPTYFLLKPYKRFLSIQQQQ